MLTLGLIAPITASAQYGAATATGGYLPSPAPAASAAPVGQPPAPATQPPVMGVYQPIAQDPSQMDAPAGYQPASAVQSAPAGQPMPGPAPAPLAHVHKGKNLCPACAAKQGITGMPPGMKIVGCAHSKNGVCTACQAALNAPGTFIQPGAPAAAPGRAVASSSGSAAGGYDPSMEGPMPVGVVQAGFLQSSSSMMMMQPPMGAGMQANAPGRAVAESAPSQSRDFYQTKSNGGFPHPHIIGHLLGWSGIGSERREEKARKKAEAHAMLTYDPNAPTGVNELPASSVFGKQK
jgi:hypothetical protein